MTVIAYRNGVLACDSAWSNGDYVYDKQTKIRRLPSGALYGSAGDSDDRALVRLLAKVTKGADLPSRAALAEIPNEIEALLILPSGHVFTIETGKDACADRVRAKFVAIGSGRTMAFGAMAFGATAAQACTLTAQHDLNCRPPIYTLEMGARRNGTRHDTRRR